MASHRVSENAGGAGQRRQIGRHDLGKFAGDVTVHAVIRRPRRLGRVHVKSGALPEIPHLRIARDAGFARTSVGRDQHQAQFGGNGLGMRLDGKGLLGAGQSREVVQHRHAAGLRLRRLIDGKLHGSARFAGIMFVELLLAAEAGMLGYELNRGHVYTVTQRSELTAILTLKQPAKATRTELEAAYED